MNFSKDITSLIGKTPLVKINSQKKHENSGCSIFAKLEYFNPMGSVKDRLALALINDAEQKKLINKDSVIIEPTSGNTGIGLAYICAVKKYKLILCMPETMSIERRQLLKSFGAKLVLTPGDKGMKGSIAEAQKIHLATKNSFIPNQFENPANPQIHKTTTALEIWDDTNGMIDYFIAGVGTGGTITGVGEFLKNKNKNIKVIAVEPYESSVLSGFEPSPHKIQGIGAGFIPKILNKSIIDEIIRVKHEEALSTCKAMAINEGILCGISSGAAMFAAFQIAQKNKSKNICTLLPDSGERYLSLGLFD